MMNNSKIVCLLIILSVFSGSTWTTNIVQAQNKKPNILFVISDDQSYPHASAYGENWIQTPGFDRVAREGALFTSAFVNSPGCAPSRASLLTGMYPWQIEHAGNHHSLFPKEYQTFPFLLQENGYHIGYTGKGSSPTWWIMSGRMQDPAGPEYNKYRGNHFRNFEDFMADRPEDEPFFLWLGPRQPHRKWERDAGITQGKNLSDVNVPGFLPDTEVVRMDLLDYAAEIEKYDAHLVKILDYLDSAQMLDNTLIIVTSDNGIAMPHAKAFTFEYGLHVPLAIRWKDKIKPRQVTDQLISLVDIMPTILEATGISFDQKNLSGKNIFSALDGGKFVDEPLKDYIFAGRERHSSSRWLNLGYPQRAIRSKDYLYIRNFHPERWPAGAPQKILDDGSLGPMHGDGQQTLFQGDLFGAYMDIDPGPTMNFLIENREDPKIKPYFELAVGKIPGEQLFDIKKDPYNLVNLADSVPFLTVKALLSAQLESRLIETQDPRLVGDNPDVFEGHKRYSGVREFPKPDWAEKLSEAEIAELKKRIEVDESPLVWDGQLLENGLIVGNWKLIEVGNKEYELYDLETDPEEKNNIANQKSEVRGNMAGFYHYWKGKEEKK